MLKKIKLKIDQIDEDDLGRHSKILTDEAGTSLSWRMVLIISYFRYLPLKSYRNFEQKTRVASFVTVPAAHLRTYYIFDQRPFCPIPFPPVMREASIWF
jgi:hypothetical protein